ncbi:hypothetical protein GQX73_g8992 [Xylaria multiplex]|uniref:Uncharacterized protein n=1 Tax=Xylaria multiplex TaxID=323545 RepID=A0A7C8N1Z7_9PEZI|nr:hypothetical protein GQX73_g8992 [Xylaria multiplex]
METWEPICEFASMSLFDDTPSSPRRDVLTPDYSTYAGSISSEPNVELSPIQKIHNGVVNNWIKRGYTTRYERVIVLMISWEEHDLGSSVEESRRQYTLMFRSLYNYDVWHFAIPSKKPHIALASELIKLAEQDSPETLFIICGEESQMVDSSIISTTLSDCEGDILLIINACSSLTCDRFHTKGIVESISASAFNTSTFGSISGNDLSPSMGWAAHKILMGEKCVEEGITIPELHRRICLATQWAGSSNYVDFDELHEPEDGIDWHTSDTRTQPVYTRLSADAPGPGGRTRGIVLRKLVTKPHSAGGTDRFIIVKLGVEDFYSIDAKEWTEWIMSAPSGVWFPKIEAVLNDAVTCPWGF